MLGKWARQEGGVVGFLKGIYGRSTSYGGWVFFGKIIDLQGSPLGLLSGRFADGKFRGTWVDERGEMRGTLKGFADQSQRFFARWKQW